MELSFKREKICSVEVNLDVPSIEVHSHNLPSYIPGYNGFFMTVEYCDGLVVYATENGIGICNPLLRQIRWIKSKVNYRYNGVGYDNSRPENHYKIFESCPYSDTTVKASITEFVSDAWISKPYEFAYDWDFMSSYSVSLNGALYWVAFHMASDDQFIQSFDFSTEKFEPYCLLPNKKCDPSNARSLAVFRGDRFSYLEQNYETRNIEIWVTKKEIKIENGKAVEWMNLMKVSVPKWSSLREKACIYIAKGDKFHEIIINDLVEYPTRHHRTYVPSLVPVPTFTMSNRSKTQQVESRFTPPRGIQASDGGNEWDDGIFHNVKKINVGVNDFDTVFVKFHYSKYNRIEAGAGHGNATTHNPDDEIMIAGGDYIEAVEGTYTESHITSITFRMRKGDMMPQYGRLNGTPFSLRGERGSKAIGFYGRSSGVHLTALGVHFSPPPLYYSFPNHSPVFNY
ncbi:putative protein [Arabidopsis thaliana]|uniref:Jacalin-related lectin 37 n=1 Tax=Arabidopsis thaliana TaxID=3702 RepID=JAL37_ARATH|nr:jacalin lectin family protein [Arabidopsis thaliana]Q9M1A9.1 RecName: Full=Jacalin-related lectin 37 [Arabidopsis thaliana]AEE79943.1 jacalin lectin family protein [Arabidopsis thaliana]CAB75456.1 putative protein [Arabidopsis thaliana]|eukprot:NP_191518.1 jacalin lectin family protein [Arabidopsis thaliana]